MIAVSDEQLAAIIASLGPAASAAAGALVNHCEVCGEPMTVVAPGQRQHPNCCEGLDDTIKRIVAAADANSARSQQTDIGFSELGNPCDRFLAHKAHGTEATNTSRDNWLAIVGTAVHAWLEKAYAAENTRLGRARFAIEDTVYATDHLYGHGDLYDYDGGGRVIDHKILGVTKLRKIKKGEISPEYRAQLHLYGYGHRRAGRPVAEVILAVYPRNDSLRGDYGGHGLHLHREPYDEQIALDAIARYHGVVEYSSALDLGDHPDRWPLIPVGGDDCVYCPFHRPTGGPADDTGCPGLPTILPTTLPGLI